MGVAVGDYDNDGFSDIYVTNFGKNILYHNNGDGTFTDVTAKAGVAAGGWSASAGFFDYDNDGLLDLFVTRYLDWSVEKAKPAAPNNPPIARPAISRRSPTSSTAIAATARSKTSASLPASRRKKATAWASRSPITTATATLISSSRTMPSNSFSSTIMATAPLPNVAFESGAALSENGKALSGMGVVFQDYDNDGRPDLLVTQLPHEPYAVFHNDGKGLFSAQELEAGFGVLSGAQFGLGSGPGRF